MELWFTELDESNCGLSIKIKNTLYSGQSDYQRLDIVESERFGKLLLLDGRIMLTEFDEFIYHEIITHVPLFAHPCPQKVLVIGGGDGGTVREIVKHPTIEHVDLVEIDGLVIKKAKEFLPFTSCQLDNPNVTVHIEDGIKFVENCKNEYDVAIIDSTDPIGPAVGLFRSDFYQSVLQALTVDGIMVAQTESLLLHRHLIREIFSELFKVFPKVQMYLATNISYIGYLWSFAFATKNLDHLTHLEEKRIAQLQPTFRYYNYDVHRAAFMLPTFAAQLLTEIRPR